MEHINVVVALGPPSEDMYYIGVGRQVYHNNLPRSLLNQIEEGAMSNTTLSYISLDKDGEYWCAESFVGPTGVFYFRREIWCPRNLTDLL